MSLLSKGNSRRDYVDLPAAGERSAPPRQRENWSESPERKSRRAVYLANAGTSGQPLAEIASRDADKWGLSLADKINRREEVMDVEWVKDLSGGHLIELGNSTWAPDEERSIRDRWPAKSPSGFNPRNSSEVPIASIVPMLTFAGEHDELSIEECTRIIESLSESIRRQHSSGK